MAIFCSKKVENTIQLISACFRKFKTLEYLISA